MHKGAEIMLIMCIYSKYRPVYKLSFSYSVVGGPIRSSGNLKQIERNSINLNFREFGKFHNTRQH